LPLPFLNLTMNTQVLLQLKKKHKLGFG
jgi:small nuclear ribonucleoprotein (snRNP)-like protein